MKPLILKSLLVLLLVPLTIAIASCGGPQNLLTWAEIAQAEPVWKWAAGVNPEKGRRIFVAPVDYIRDTSKSAGHWANPYHEIQSALDVAKAGDYVLVAAGHYKIAPNRATDSLGGNLDNETCICEIPITVGLQIRTPCTLLGAGPDQVVITTNAGYGIWVRDHFDPEEYSRPFAPDRLLEADRIPRRTAAVPQIRDLPSAVIEGLTITGGIRDADGRATSGAIVVRNAHVSIANCDIVLNSGAPEGLDRKYPGVIGVAAREGSHVSVANTLIAGNSWDGIAAYRSHPKWRIPATVEASRCTIRGGSGGGSGAGVGVTWDARARLREIEVYGYWKGVGSFGQSEVVLESSIVRSLSGWGVIATQDSRMAALGNVIHRAGTTGLARWSPGAEVFFANNIVMQSGLHTTEWVGKRVGLWLNPGAVTDWIRHNCLWDNNRADCGSGGVPGNEDEPVVPVLVEGVHGNTRTEPRFDEGGRCALAADSPLRTAGDQHVEMRLAAWLERTSFPQPPAPKAGEPAPPPRPIGLPEGASPGCVRG